MLHYVMGGRINGYNISRMEFATKKQETDKCPSYNGS